MASELLKNRALIQRLKEPEVPKVNFDLASTGFEELFTLPESKPQELLDIQENVRIQRQQDTMDKASPFLMDESVDFIERQDKAIGGGLFSGTDLGTREGFAGIRYNLQSLGGEGNEYIKTFETKGIEEATSVAGNMIDKLYFYDFGEVLFKPTLSGGSQTFRPTKEGALSYFVGHNSSYPNDSGFGIKFWRARI